jgi:hypothetical protein
VANSRFFGKGRENVMKNLPTNSGISVDPPEAEISNPFNHFGCGPEPDSCTATNATVILQGFGRHGLPLGGLHNVRERPTRVLTLLFHVAQAADAFAPQRYVLVSTLTVTKPCQLATPGRDFQAAPCT